MPLTAPRPSRSIPRKRSATEDVPVSAYRSPMIKIKVGKPAKGFSIHKDLLCRHSTYFRGALNGSFEEAKSRKIVLEEDDPETFAVFASWIYSGRLYDPQVADGANEDYNKHTTVALTQQELANVWVLGDMRGIPALQNEALNSIHKHFDEANRISYTSLNTAFACTPEGSKLRAYYVEMWAQYYGPLPEALHEEFVRELCNRLLALKSLHRVCAPPEKFVIDLCKFHIHEDVNCKGRKVKRPASAAATALPSLPNSQEQ